VLIAAHPGHELLLHHWLERARPVVCVLTDGSGSQAGSRSERSKRIVHRTGAQIGPVFGELTDRVWYEAILSGDWRPFDRAAAQIADMCRAQGVTQIVSDAFEFFNPMHDLCSCLARSVSMRLRGRGAVELLTFPIERPDLLRGAPAHLYSLDGDALNRKLASCAEYLELSAEVARRRVTARDDLAVECLFAADAGQVSAGPPAERPFYETVGRERVGRGMYSELITYEGHVRPLATMLTAGGC
jgi:hypothetical protein